jgi:hypothetical protein
MNKPWIVTRLPVVALFAVAAALAQAQTPPAPVTADGVSDVGAFEAVPYAAPNVVLLRPDEKATLRKLEDRQIQELRSLEDRYEKDLRALRAKQYAERQALIKSFERR